MQNQSCSPSTFPPAFWEFVGRHRNDDVAKLRLKFHGKGEAWTDSAITHIECLKKCGKKFGSLQPRLMLSPLSVEQATSESVALLHASIAKRVAGNARLMLDMTCGMGIDLMAMQNALGCQAIGIEMNPHLASATAYNFSDKRDVEILCDDSVAWLNRYDGAPIDLVFIDPARRGSAGQRVFNIHHCQPDVSVLMPVLEVKSRVVIVKLSPMLDVTQTLRDLPNTTELHLIDEGGECREMLAVIKMGQDAANTPPD
ncbi:MAG: class I SAM-dependent methyltransferase [Muribaculaceae bacterium]|nr:class I SAM-dependent methyltransferase [Muribaculaceae bacterium]